jgi:hypothetical protein
MSAPQSFNTTQKLGAIKVKNFIDNNNARIVNVGDPLSSSDVATKNYVDSNLTSSEIFAGTGLTKTGTTFSVNSSLTHVTAIGNINIGTWSANTINVPYGGTGKSSFTANKLLMGDGVNPIISISQVSFESNRLITTAPLVVSNTVASTGIGSGGSLTVLGGASISGKLWLGNDLSVSNNLVVSGDMTVGNLKINGTSSFGAVSANDSSYTNATIDNLVSTNITSANLNLTNIRSTNLTTSNAIVTSITNTNMITTNISSSSLNVINRINATDIVVSNFTTGSILTTNVNTINTTTTNIRLTNITGSSAVLSNILVSTSITSPNVLSSSITSTSINGTNGSITSMTHDNLIVNTNTILSNTTTSNLFNTNITTNSIITTNVRSANFTTTNLIATHTNITNINSTNVTCTNAVSTNITTNSIITTNVTNVNLSTVNLLGQNISSATLNISGISILSSVSANNITTGTLFVSGTTNLQNTTMTNNTVSNITNTNFTNTNSTISNLNSTNISCSNLQASNLVTLGSVGSINLSTGNIHSSSTATLNNAAITTSTISNLRVTNVSVLGTVNSNNLSTGSIHVSTSLTVPLVNNTTQTTTNLLSTNVRSTNISSSSLQISGVSILGTVNSNNLSTGSLFVSSTSNLINVRATNITVPNIFTTSITVANVKISEDLDVSKHINIGSNFSAAPNTTSGNILNIVPSVFTDIATTNGGTVPFWATNFFANSTLSAQNIITTQRVCSMYLQGDPIAGANQTFENSAALAIGYVNNQTGGNITGQIILERNDGNWYGSIFTESSTNKIVIANASLSGGGGIGLYTYVGTKVTFADIPSATNIVPTTFAEFSNVTSRFFSTTNSNSASSGSVIIDGGLGVAKTITCDSIKTNDIDASIKKLNDVDSTMNPTTGQALVWNGSMWTSSTIAGGGGGSSATSIQVFPMELVMPVMDSNGPVEGNDGDYYVSASSEWSSIYSAYKCLSSVISPTDWATSGETSDFWITVQLPQSQNVRYVVLEGRINNEDPLTVTIQGSNDNTTFTNIHTDLNFTALNYNGYFAARIPENSKDYTYYKFLFPTGSGINPGLNMLRLFRYDDLNYTEGILDNSAVEGNGKFNSAINNGRWPMAFQIVENGVVNVRAQITCTTSSIYVLKKIVMYIDGAPFDSTGSSFIKQTIHQNLHIATQTIEWTGSLTAGVHTISFFVDGGAGVIFDTNDTIRVYVTKY